MIRKIALLPGHSSRDGGAEVCAGLHKGKSEYLLAGAYYLPALADKLRALGYDTCITTRDVAGGTTPSYSAKAANATGADMALEFHFNAATATATGCEVLHWGGSSTGRAFAATLSASLAGIQGVRDRGPLGIHTAADRGYAAFAKSRMPFFMVEPCFAGSNPQEAEAFCRQIESGEWAEQAAAAIHAAICKIYR